MTKRKYQIKPKARIIKTKAFGIQELGFPFSVFGFWAHTAHLIWKGS
jgi:hypothetical protein